MANDMIRYDVLAQDALRGMLRKLLMEVSQTGLPGEHHFFVTFSTTALGVRISNRLKAQYPEEMTIVLQHQFWDLIISEQSFEIGLSFNAIPERLHVPFAAIKAFYDPSVQFGLQFDPEVTRSADDGTNDDVAEPSLPDDDAVLPTAVEELHATRPLLPSEREKQREAARKLAEEAARRDTEQAARTTAEADNDADGDSPDDAGTSPDGNERADAEPDGSDDEDAKGADVVSLDSFRKKN
uniref:SspB family protein n=1 Tax=Pararhizobium sp. IMCC3301 TaxID=3067904 RepID=UPI002740F3CC|nr:ClpXP protease specificity-enhancing factor SspB [Pararhizobium sp. IMCC3301]